MTYRVLVVEDYEDTRAILRAILLYHGYEVTEVQTAEEMFERLAEVDPDLIVLDIRLPGMDGCAALAMLREMEFDKPIFFFSEYYDLFAEQIRGCKPDGFFPKSKGPIPLLEGIRQKLPLRADRSDNGAIA
ncbi:MAG TPA: response regulator [Longimicrobiales bacterium]